MTTGTNLQLTYDEANDSWSYQNVDYEYPSGSTNSWSGFTSPDPEFEYTPPAQDQEQDNSTVCPPGYIYDETLLQCVPDPNYRAPAYAGEPTGRTEEDQPDPVFKSFDASTPEGRKDMFEHGRDKGYFTTDTKKGGAYEFQGAPKTDMPFPILKGLAQFGEDRQYNRYINELNKENNKRIAAGQTPILAQAIGFFGLSTTFKNWGSYAVDAASNVRTDTDTTTGFQKLKATVPTYLSGGDPLKERFDRFGQKPVSTTEDVQTFKDKLAEGRKQEIHEQNLNQEIQKTEQQQIKTQQVKDEYKDKGQVTYSTKDTGGYVTTPHEPEAPPSEKGGGGYVEPPKTCFHPEQLIGNKFMKDLEPGDLINGIKILGMVKMKLDEDMYSLNDIKVTGSHKVKYNDNWIFIFNHPESFKINDKPEFVYVPIVKGGTFILNNNEFADYDDEHIETLNNKLKVA